MSSAEPAGWEVQRTFYCSKPAIKAQAKSIGCCYISLSRCRGSGWLSLLAQAEDSTAMHTFWTGSVAGL